MEKAHGLNKFWLHPLYEKSNTEAGCQQCHTQDRVLQGADNLTLGKDLFQNRGCVGCHRSDGFDREADALGNTRQQILQLEETIKSNDREARAAKDEVANASVDKKHTVFGEVISGIEVVDKIAPGDKMNKVWVE